VREQQDEALRLYRRHPFLNTARHEGARVHTFGKQAGLNALGYRSPDRPLPRPPGGLRLLCAGGSTTFDLLAASDDRSWPWRLEQKLRRTRPQIKVWNASFPGWTSLESLISFAPRDADLEPGLVIVYHGDNDLQPSGYRPIGRQHEHGHAELALRALGFERKALPWRSRSVLLEHLSAAWARPGDPWASLDPHEPRQPHMVTRRRRHLRPQCALAGGASPCPRRPSGVGHPDHPHSRLPGASTSPTAAASALPTTWLGTSASNTEGTSSRGVADGAVSESALEERSSLLTTAPTQR
jgi:hypothetical protein